jgi:hypothetical protein
VQDAGKRLRARCAALARYGPDAALMPGLYDSLNADYDLARKAAATPGLEEILLELMDRLVRGFGSLSATGGKRVLDIACGSSTSRAPNGRGEYSALFEPWLCRILHACGASAVGVDRGALGGEKFGTHELDLGEPGALGFLPSGSFDAVHDSRLFGSPEFTARFKDRRSISAIAAEIRRQESRLLKPGGIILHSDASELTG